MHAPRHGCAQSFLATKRCSVSYRTPMKQRPTKSLAYSSSHSAGVFCLGFLAQKNADHSLTQLGPRFAALFLRKMAPNGLNDSWSLVMLTARGTRTNPAKRGPGRHGGANVLQRAEQRNRHNPSRLHAFWRQTE